MADSTSRLSQRQRKYHCGKGKIEQYGFESIRARYDSHCNITNRKQHPEASPIKSPGLNTLLSGFIISTMPMKPITMPSQILFSTTSLSHTSPMIGINIGAVFCSSDASTIGISLIAAAKHRNDITPDAPRRISSEALGAHVAEFILCTQEQAQSKCRNVLHEYGSTHFAPVLPASFTHTATSERKNSPVSADTIPLTSDCSVGLSAINRIHHAK